MSRTLPYSSLTDSVQWEMGLCEWRTDPDAARSTGDSEVYENVSCDGCGCPIRGARWKCSVCADYDLCDVCHSQFHATGQYHTHGHEFNRRQVRYSADVKAQLAALTSLDLSKHVLETSRVFGGSDDRRRQWETENNLAHLLEYTPGLRKLHVPSAMNLRCDAARRRPQPVHLALIGLALPPCHAPLTLHGQLSAIWTDDTRSLLCHQAQLTLLTCNCQVRERPRNCSRA